MLTSEQIGATIVHYKLECGALNNNKWYASYKRYPSFVADTLEAAIEECINFWKDKGIFQ